VGDDPQAAFAEFGGKIPGEVRTGQIKQRRGLLQLLGFYPCQHEVAQARGVATGCYHMGEPGAAGGAGGMLADCEQRQLEQAVALEFDAAQRIGAGDDDRAAARVQVGMERDRLEPQHRRQQHLETFAAKCRGSGLVVRVRAGNEDSHVSASQLQAFCINGRLHFETPQCYARIGKRRFGR
jgi:hypothetical protein